jgi:hypothetical protein
MGRNGKTGTAAEPSGQVRAGQEVAGRGGLALTLTLSQRASEKGAGARR